MTTYKAEGFRPVEAETINEAGEILAKRLARRDYGGRGYVRILKHESWDQDGSFCTFKAFIGHDGEQAGETVGHEATIVVTRSDL